MNAYEKLLKVQTELKAPKSQYNKFGNYNYRNCEDILEAAKPICQEVKAAILVSDELVMIGERYYIKATADFVDCETESIISGTAFAREEESKKGMDASQVTGSSSSYARKYALNGLLAIDDTKDSDTTNTGSATKPKATTAKKEPSQAKTIQQPVNTRPATAGEARATDAMIGCVKAELIRTGITEKTVLGMYNIKKLEEMTLEQYQGCMKKFKITPDKKETVNE